MKKPTVGIVGTGKLGLALATRIAQASYPVLMTGRPGNADSVLATVAKQVPDAEVTDFRTLAHQVEFVILALPQESVLNLDLRHIGGIVIDATNPWSDQDVVADEAAFTQRLARTYPHTTFVKAFNHTAYFEFYTDARPAGDPERRALAVAGPDSIALRKVAALISDIGFDSVPVYSRGAKSIAMDGELFGRKLGRDELAALLQQRGAIEPADTSAILDVSFESLSSKNS